MRMTTSNDAMRPVWERSARSCASQASSNGSYSAMGSLGMVGFSHFDPNINSREVGPYLNLLPSCDGPERQHPWGIAINKIPIQHMLHTVAAGISRRDIRGNQES